MDYLFYCFYLRTVSENQQQSSIEHKSWALAKFSGFLVLVSGGVVGGLLVSAVQWIDIEVFKTVLIIAFIVVNIAPFYWFREERFQKIQLQYKHYDHQIMIKHAKQASRAALIVMVIMLTIRGAVLG